MQPDIGGIVERVVAISSSCTGAKKVLKPSWKAIPNGSASDPKRCGPACSIFRHWPSNSDFEGVQETLHADIVPVMGTLYENSGNCNHVRATVAYVLTTFASAEIALKAILPYLQPLLEGLFSVLYAECAFQCAGTNPSIAKVAVVAGENFGDFYDGFMPAAKTIISQATSPEVQELRGKPWNASH